MDDEQLAMIEAGILGALPAEAHAIQLDVYALVAEVRRLRGIAVALKDLYEQRTAEVQQVRMALAVSAARSR